MDDKYDVSETQCNDPDCTKSFKNHRWGKIKGAEGWFISKDGEQAWCPDHLPDWVADWRRRQKEKVKK